MSHFALIYLVLAEQAKQGVDLEGLRFTALTPQALRVEPFRVESREPATLRSQERVLPVTRYRLAIGEGEDPLRMDLYALDDERVLLAVYIPRQPRLASSAAILIYRSDLYPQGFEVPEGP
jgi:hypothetical protein